MAQTLTLEERKLMAIKDLIPVRTDRTPITLDVYDRLRVVISSATRVTKAWPDLVQWDFDNADLCQEILKNTGCNSQDCIGNGTMPYWELPWHIYQHLLTPCIAWADCDPRWACHDGIQNMRNAQGEVGAPCKYCTGGVMDNLQRGIFDKAYKEWLKPLTEEEKEEDYRKEING